MVVKIAWEHSWIVLSISIAALFVLILLLLICLCWEPNRPHNEQMYIINEEEGIKPVLPQYVPCEAGAENGKFFGKFSYPGRFIKNGFSLFDNGGNKPPVNEFERHNNWSRLERELMDSHDFDKEFGNCILQIDTEMAPDIFGSQGSLNTFYSVLHTRRNSYASSMKSTISQSDSETL